MARAVIAEEPCFLLGVDSLAWAWRTILRSKVRACPGLGAACEWLVLRWDFPVGMQADVVSVFREQGNWESEEEREQGTRWVGIGRLVS